MENHESELTTVRLTTPIDDAQLARLRIGNVVYINGVIMTGREGVYKRLLADGDPPPADSRRRRTG